MKFTSRDVQCPSLKNFIRTRITSDKTVIIDDYLFNVYDSTKIIEVLEHKIKKNKVGTKYTRFVPIWENHIKVLKQMSS